jgi:hypothetical protein
LSPPDRAGRERTADPSAPPDFDDARSTTAPPEPRPPSSDELRGSRGLPSRRASRARRRSHRSGPDHRRGQSRRRDRPRGGVRRGMATHAGARGRDPRRGPQARSRRCAGDDRSIDAHQSRSGCASSSGTSAGPAGAITSRRSSRGRNVRTLSFVLLVWNASVVSGSSRSTHGWTRGKRGRRAAGLGSSGLIRRAGTASSLGWPATVTTFDAALRGTRSPVASSLMRTPPAPSKNAGA